MFFKCFILHVTTVLDSHLTDCGFVSVSCKQKLGHVRICYLQPNQCSIQTSRVSALPPEDPLLELLLTVRGKEGKGRSTPCR